MASVWLPVLKAKVSFLETLLGVNSALLVVKLVPDKTQTNVNLVLVKIFYFIFKIYIQIYLNLLNIIKNKNIIFSIKFFSDSSLTFIELMCKYLPPRIF
jgi:hypothetical protein